MHGFMEYKRYGNKIFLRLDSGEEIVRSLKQLCEKEEIKLGTVSGIGATDRVAIGLFDLKNKKYVSKEFVGDHEIAPLFGNITTKDGDIYLHIHVNICDSEHKSFGGHLNSGIVSATFEGVIDVIDGVVEREFDEKTGLNLIRMQ